MDKPKSGEVVPFGKYKGQPVERMMADASYCEWMSAQPWFHEKFAALFAIIINGGAAPDAETPEHNRMQALFLDPKLCRALASALGVTMRLDSSPAFEIAGWDLVVWTNTTGEDLHVELKPQLGDDYPAVLRAIRSRSHARGRLFDFPRHRVLVVDRFNAEGASYDQVKRIFKASGVEVRSLAEIQALNL